MALEDNRIGWWRFNGNLLDSSGNNKTLLANSSNFATDKDGNPNSCMGANSRLGLNEKLILNVNNEPFSYYIWFEKNISGSTQVLIGNGSYTAGGCYVQQQGGLISVTADTRQYIISDAASIPEGWNLISVTFTGSILKVKLNNILKVDYPISIGAPAGGYQKFAVGCYTDRNSYPWKSKYDEAAVYNRALTDEEETLIYSRGVNDTTPPSFNSVSIDTITNKSAILNVSCDMDATCYYKIYIKDHPAPTSEDLVNTHDGEISLIKNIISIEEIKSLSLNTDYDLYLVAKSSSNILQDTPTKVQFKTLSNSIGGVNLGLFQNIASSQEHSVKNEFLVGIHGQIRNTLYNKRDSLAYNITNTQNTIEVNSDWTGYTGDIIIESEVMRVTNATGNILTVDRGMYSTKPLTHLLSSKIYTITILRNIEGYNYEEISEARQGSPFSVSVESGQISIMDSATNWNKLNPTSTYLFKKNKKVFILEGCNGELVKVYEGLTFSKNSGFKGKVAISIKGMVNEWYNKDMNIIKTYESISLSDLLLDLFYGKTVIFKNNESNRNITNLYTGNYKTYGELLNYLSSELQIRIWFGLDDTIILFSDYDQINVIPVTTMQKTLLDIESSDESNLIINRVKGNYYQLDETYDTEAYTTGGKLQYTNWLKSKIISVSTNIIVNKVFVEVILNGFTSSDISFMTRNDYILLKNNNSPYQEIMCKLYDFDTTAGSISLITGIDKMNDLNQYGRLDMIPNLTFTNFTCYWALNDMMTVYKFQKDYGSGTKSSSLRFPLLPNIEEVVNIKFGISDNGDFKFSNIIKGLENIIGVGWIDNSKLLYGMEKAQNELGVPIYLYTNKLDDGVSDFKISSMDNSNVMLRIDESSGTNYDLVLTILNTIPTPTTTEHTPLVIYNSQTLISVSASDYNTLKIGDCLVLSEVTRADGSSMYMKYLKFKPARYSILSKFLDSGVYYIELDNAYPLAVDAVNFSFIRYPRSSIIHLNELYIRGNPVMQIEQSYDYSSLESIEDNGETSISIEGKIMKQDDFEKRIAYYKDSYFSTNINNTRSLLKIKVPMRLDLQVLDVVEITDNTYTGMESQKAVITKKSVKNDRGIRGAEEYELLTIGGYTINSSTLNFNNSSNSKMPYANTYTHRGDEDSTTKSNSDSIDNKTINLLDNSEGSIFIKEVPQGIFSAYTNITKTITSNDSSSYIHIDNITGNYDYINALFILNKIIVIKIATEYIYVKVLSYTDSTKTASFQIIKRGLGDSGVVNIEDNMIVNFYSLLAKVGNSLESTSLDVGNSENSIVITEGNGRLSFNNGQQQLGHITGITGKDDFYGMFLGNTVLTDKNYVLYDENGIRFEGRYFNKTAYCATSNDLIGAINTSKALLCDGTSNPFYGLTVSNIILTTRDNGTSAYSFQSFYDYDLAHPSAPYSSLYMEMDIKDIYSISSIHGTNTTIDFCLTGLGLYTSLSKKEIFNVSFLNMGDISADISAINCLNDSSISLKNINIILLKGLIRSCYGIENVNIKSYGLDNLVFFLECENIRKVNVDISGAFSVTEYSYGLFHSCKDIQQITFRGNRDSNIEDYRWLFKNCKDISAITNYTGFSAMFDSCNGISGVVMGGVTRSNNNPHPSFNYCNGISDVFNGWGWLPSSVIIISHCDYVQNCENIYMDNIEYITYDTNNTWNYTGIGQVIASDVFLSTTLQHSWTLIKRNQLLHIYIKDNVSYEVGENTNLDIDSVQTGSYGLYKIYYDIPNSIWKLKKIQQTRDISDGNQIVINFDSNTYFMKLIAENIGYGDRYITIIAQDSN